MSIAVTSCFILVYSVMSGPWFVALAYTAFPIIFRAFNSSARDSESLFVAKARIMPVELLDSASCCQFTVGSGVAREVKYIYAMRLHLSAVMAVTL